VNFYTVIVGVPLAAFAIAFLIGSIPFGYLIGRAFYGTDIRTKGSGNIGAMNALRTMGKGGAIAVLLLDAVKGFAPVYYVASNGHGTLQVTLRGAIVSIAWPQALAAIIAAGAVLGHCYSPWLKFKGGKGVATSFGAIFGLCWPAGLVAVAGWIAGAAITRYSSVGSMLGSILAPIALWFVTGSIPETAYGVFAAILIVLRHRDNIGRIRAGTEGPIRLSKPKAL